MTRVLLLGADGLLGSHVYETLKNEKGVELISTSRTSSSYVKFDYKIGELGSLLERYRPNIVINCIAVTSSNSSLLRLFKVNGILPVQLAILGIKSKIRVVHISSNAVFSGKRIFNLESTIPLPHSRYGMSKLLGDLALFGGLVIRTSFVGVSKKSRSAKGVVDELVHLPINSSFRIHENFKWNGVTAGALSEFIRAAIRLEDFPRGIIHLGTIEKLNRQQLVEILLNHLGRDDISVIASSQKNFRNMSLDSKKRELISKIWSSSNYGSTPTIFQMIQELPVTN